MKAEAEAIAAAKVGLAGSSTGAVAYSDITPYRSARAQNYNVPDYSADARAKGGDDAYAGVKLPTNGDVKN